MVESGVGAAGNDRSTAREGGSQTIGCTVCWRAKSIGGVIGHHYTVTGSIKRPAEVNLVGAGSGCSECCGINNSDIRSYFGINAGFIITRQGRGGAACGEESVKFIGALRNFVVHAERIVLGRTGSCKHPDIKYFIVEHWGVGKCEAFIRSKIGRENCICSRGGNNHTRAV